MSRKILISITKSVGGRRNRVLLFLLITVAVFGVYSQDNVERSLMPKSNFYYLDNGWLYTTEHQSSGSYMFVRSRLSDFKRENLSNCVNYLDIVAIGNNQIFSRGSSGLFKQSINNSKLIQLKKLVNNNVLWCSPSVRPIFIDS